MWANLVLDAYLVADSQRWKTACVLAPAFSGLHMAVAKSFFSGGERLLPCGMWPVIAGIDRNEIPDRATEQDGGGRHLGFRVGCVSILQHGLPELVRVDGATGPRVAHDHPLHCFDSDLGSAV